MRVNRIPVVLLLLLAMLAALASRWDAAPSVVVGKTSAGNFQYHGHQLAPPYVVRVEFTAGPDTQWVATYINDLPLAVHLSTPPSAQVLPVTAQTQLLDRLLTTHLTGPGRAGELQQQLRSVASDLERDTALVDSSRVVDDHLLEVYWRGDPRPLRRMFSQTPGITGQERWRQARVHAARIVKALEQNRLVIWSHGTEIYVTRSNRPEAEAGIANLRQGRPTDVQVLRSPRLQREFAAPVELAQIKRTYGAAQ